MTEPLGVGDRVVARMAWAGTGRGPGLNLELTFVLDAPQGFIFEIEFLWDHAEAVEAVGLREQGDRLRDTAGMSEENVEILRRFAKVFQTGDLERVVSEFFDPEIEWRTSAEDPDAATYRGPEAYKRYVEQWWESFEGLHAQVEEYIDAGDDRVFTWVRWTGRGRASGVDSDWHLAINYTMRDGKVVLAEEYFDREEALEAVGLRE